MDMRKDLGGVVIRRDQADIYLNRVLEDSDRLLRFVIGHECIHIAHPSERHGSKKWKEAVRILAAKGFFERYF
jgi:predicted metal-dependent hydrolase